MSEFRDASLNFEHKSPFWRDRGPRGRISQDLKAVQMKTEKRSISFVDGAFSGQIGAGGFRGPRKRCAASQNDERSERNARFCVDMAVLPEALRGKRNFCDKKT